MTLLVVFSKLFLIISALGDIFNVNSWSEFFKSNLSENKIFGKKLKREILYWEQNRNKYFYVDSKLRF